MIVSVFICSAVSDQFTPSAIVNKYSSSEEDLLDLRIVAVLLIAHLDRLAEKHSPPSSHLELGATINVGPVTSMWHVPMAVEIQVHSLPLSLPFYSLIFYFRLSSYSPTTPKVICYLSSPCAITLIIASLLL